MGASNRCRGCVLSMCTGGHGPATFLGIKRTDLSLSLFSSQPTSQPTTTNMLLARLASLATGIIVPLYIFPGDPGICASWTPLINSITAQPNLRFHVIINPNSGPGTTAQPDASYQSCVAKLKHPNVELVGYVPTGFGSRAQSAVTADINTYAGWASAYALDGIFFDEVSGTAGDLGKYTTYVSHARQVLKGGSGAVTLNPGAQPTAGYFGIADLVATREDFFNDFSPSQLTLGSSTPANKQAVILHDAPSAPPSSIISQLVATDRIGALYITDDVQANNGNPYDSLPSDLAAFVSAVAAAQ
ncbi:Spherulation-specific family 4-domain-containing protein [Cristinia sonorae]|uniref:Spherulation-specific family 4-domain-containing protein n=1 Tax=Cristinia sonorae TaxID=1940300 RepID=A0A8K0UW06_9AGAR|nr:Spherulation-specific family 4-domain-containing protein [Cristinia sonorae]